MPLDQAISAYVKLMEKVFSDKKMVGTHEPSEYKGTKLRESLKSMIRDAIGNENEQMKEIQETEGGCKT